MTTDNTGVAILNTHLEAENAVKELQKAGFDMKKLSIVGKDYQSQDKVVGYYNACDRMQYWGKLGGFWGGMSALGSWNPAAPRFCALLMSSRSGTTSGEPNGLLKWM